MADSPTWKAVQEEAAFGRLNDLEKGVRGLGLQDSSQALSVLLRRRLDSGSWDWGLFEDCVNKLENEYAALDPTCSDGLAVLKRILNRTFEVKRRKGKLMEPFGRLWTGEERSQLDASLGVLILALRHSTNQETTILLASLGHLIRYETKGDFVRTRIHYWASPSVPSPEDRERLVEDFFTLRTRGTDGRSDATHIRHAIAHAHFRFFDGSVELWDLDRESGQETFRKRYSVREVLEVFNLFEMKLMLAEVYPSLMLGIEDLFSVYKRDWRSFRR